MGIFGEVARDGAVEDMVQYIAAVMKWPANQSPEAQRALKLVGRHAMTMFAWETPSWAKEFAQLFKE